MLLKDMKPDIDAGKTAKLTIERTSPNGPDITVRIALHRGVYVWQRGTIQGRRVLHAGPNTKPHDTWEELLDSIVGMQTESTDWIVCDDRLEGFPVEESNVVGK